MQCKEVLLFEIRVARLGVAGAHHSLIAERFAGGLEMSGLETGLELGGR